MPRAKISLSLVSLVALAALLAVAFSTSPDTVLALHDEELTVDVVPDLSTFSFVDVDGDGAPSAGDPFLVEGDVREEGTETVIGHYLCRGYFIVLQADGDFTFVHQSFEFTGIGTIHVEGNESGVVMLRAIVGASGDIRVRKDAVLIAEPRPDLGDFAFQGTFLGVRVD